MGQNHTSANKSSKAPKHEAPKLATQKLGAQKLDGESTPGEGTVASSVDVERLATSSGVALVGSRGTQARVDTANSRFRYDRPGHIAEAHAERLRQLSQSRAHRDEFALVFDSAARDELATELAEQAVSSMVGAGETWLDTVNAPVEEEEGGPFVETRAEREYVEPKTDTSDNAREAVPTPDAGKFAPFQGVRRGRRP